MILLYVTVHRHQRKYHNITLFKAFHLIPMKQQTTIIGVF